MSDPTVSVVRPNSLASGRDAKLDRISHVTIKIGYKHTHGHIPLHKKTKKTNVSIEHLDMMKSIQEYLTHIIKW